MAELGWEWFTLTLDTRWLPVIDGDPSPLVRVDGAPLEHHKLKLNAVEGKKPEGA